jgi:2-polyprenyl-3-methyl-5-hydroxy-6-metoxy-1,4-benzoquinol methylase
MPSLHAHTPDTHDIASFYDDRLEQRLRDYIYGNERITAALELAASLIDRSTKWVLDVGCGLGISASRIAETGDWVKVHAVDISPKTISAAVSLFGENNRVTFEASEMLEVPRFAPYDIIMLLDVYEHIPRETWPRFNSILGRSLSPTGSIVLTAPSPLHQEHLARVNPSGLQIVDEVVQLEDLAALAKDVAGQLVFFSYVSIWHTNDYLHAVIRRGPSYRPLNTDWRYGFADSNPSWLKWQRSERVVDRIKQRLDFWLEGARQRNMSARRRRLVQDRLGLALGKIK